MYKYILFITIFISFFLVGCMKLTNQVDTPNKQELLDTNITVEKIKMVDTKPIKEKVFERRYKTIPPVISHSTVNMTPIAKNKNTCLDCHTIKNQNLVSHFAKQQLKPNYYNCLSCHTQSN
jgi:nitrate reductase cytochrome c-type subunit